MKCPLCNIRKPRRYCPGIAADICSQCCGEQREQTISCPLDCPFLQEAHRHEKPPQLSPEDVPNQDVRVSDDFLHEHEPLFIYLAAELLAASLSTSSVIDYDVREALASLIRTYKTLDSGLVYETRPTNPIASAIHTKVQEAVQVLRKKLAEEGATGVRDAEVLGVLVFLQRLELGQNNGRQKGRAFMDFLHANFPRLRDTSASEPPASGLIHV